MKPEEFAALAESLSSDGGPHAAARARSSVSRYYYAAFLDARDQLRDKRNLTFKAHLAHKNVRAAFSGSATGSGLEKIGRLLEELKNLREDADYDLNVECTSLEAAEAGAIYSAIRDRLLREDVTNCVDPEGRGR